MLPSVYYAVNEDKLYSKGVAIFFFSNVRDRLKIQKKKVDDMK